MKCCDSTDATESAVAPTTCTCMVSCGAVMVVGGIIIRQHLAVLAHVDELVVLAATLRHRRRRGGLAATLAGWRGRIRLRLSARAAFTSASPCLQRALASSYCSQRSSPNQRFCWRSSSILGHERCRASAVELRCAACFNHALNKGRPCAAAASEHAPAPLKSARRSDLFKLP